MEKQMPKETKQEINYVTSWVTANMFHYSKELTYKEVR